MSWEMRMYTDSVGMTEITNFQLNKVSNACYVQSNAQRLGYGKIGFLFILNVQNINLP